MDVNLPRVTEPLGLKLCGLIQLRAIKFIYLNTPTGAMRDRQILSCAKQLNVLRCKASRQVRRSIHPQEYIDLN